MESLKKSLRPVFVFVKIDIRRLFRDRVAIFFTFAFPLIFLAVFGGLNSGDSSVSFNVALINESQTDVSKQFVDQIKKDKTYDVDEQITTVDQARQKMDRSEIDAAIILPKDFGLQLDNQAYPSGKATVLYNQNSEQAGQALASIIEAQFKEINRQFVNSEAPFTVQSESTAKAGLSRFDYTFTGLLGFTLLSLGVFGPTSVFPRLKTKGVLQRYHTTSLKVWQYFMGNVISTAAVGILSAATMFAAAIAFFDLSMKGDYISLAVFTIIATTVIFGIGLAIGGWAKNEKQAAPMAQIVALPMLFLSGTFIPRYIMPEWLQSATGFIPLSPVVDGMRMIITEGKTIFDLGPQVGLLVLWGVVIYAVAFRVFKWS